MQLQAFLRASRLSSIEQDHAGMNCWNQAAHPRCRRGLSLFLLGDLHRCWRKGVFPALFWLTLSLLPFISTPWTFNHIGFLSLAPTPVLMTAFSLSFFPFPANFGNSFLFSIVTCPHWANSTVWISICSQICFCHWVGMTCSWTKLPSWNIFFLLYLLLPSKAAGFLMCLMPVRILSQNRKIACLIQGLLS